jgi:hypothetical protein
MTEAEYKAFFERVLKKFGGSYDLPSGWLENGLSFSCKLPPILVPFPEKLSPEQRSLIVARAKAQYEIE